MIGYLKFGQSRKIWPNLVTLITLDSHTRRPRRRLLKLTQSGNLTLFIIENVITLNRGLLLCTYYLGSAAQE